VRGNLNWEKALQLDHNIENQESNKSEKIMVYNLELLETLDCIVQELFILKVNLLIFIYEIDKSDEVNNRSAGTSKGKNRTQKPESTTRILLSSLLVEF
jgi:hypothetical protein